MTEPSAPRTRIRYLLHTNGGAGVILGHSSSFYFIGSFYSLRHNIPEEVENGYHTYNRCLPIVLRFVLLL